MVSRSSDRYLGRHVCQTGQAYAITGLITDTYIFNKSACDMPDRFSWYNMYRRFPAFDITLYTCVFQVKLSLIVTPNTLAWFTRSILTSSIIIFGIELLKSESLLKHIHISLVLLELIRISLSWDHLWAISADSWIRDKLLYWHISKIVLSSTYFMISQGVRKSFIWTRKSLGPDSVPCGTPPLGLPAADRQSPTFTIWVLSRRNAAIHRMMCRGISIWSSFPIRISWLIRSKPFVWSSNSTRTKVSLWSVSSYHLCMSSTSASVVPVPLMQPNCLGRSFHGWHRLPTSTPVTQMFSPQSGLMRWVVHVCLSLLTWVGASWGEVPPWPSSTWWGVPLHVVSCCISLLLGGTIYEKSPTGSTEGCYQVPELSPS